MIDFLRTYIEMIVPPCMVVEGNIVLESWGLQIDRGNFLVDECSLDWVDPTKG
jgi:hypothetical protein